MTAVTALTGRRLLARLASEQATGRLPSVVAGVVRDGEPVWWGARGEHTGGPAAGRDLQYRIGSLTKTMTAVLVLQLRDEGRVDLSDPLEAHLPGTPYGDRTVRSLLSHSSGMPSEPPGPWWERSPGVGYAELAERVRDTDPPFPSGATHHYSNVGFGLLGELVARARGESWWEQVSQRVLAPLGMARTTYHPVRPSATGYSVHHFAGTLTEEPAHDTGAMAAAGQLWSTAEDLVRYAGFLLDGHDDVLSPATLTEMRTPQSGSVAAGLAGGYGLGLRLLAGGSGTLFGHTGSMPGFLAGLFVDPVRRSGAVCLANGTVGMRTEALPADLLDELERSEPSVAAPWRPTREVPDPVAEILGVWHWGNTAYAFCYDGDELSAAPLAGGPATLRFRWAGDDTFIGTAGYHHGESLHVVRGPGGRVSHLVCATFVYTRAPYDRAAPIPGGPPRDP